MGSHSAIRSIENINKAVKRLPNYLRYQIQQKDIQVDDTNVDLLVFSNEKIKELYNSIASIINSHEKTKQNLAKDSQIFVSYSDNQNVSHQSE